MANIVIADVHNICREALCAYIRHVDQSIAVEGVSDARRLKDYIEKNSPDLILIDRELQDTPVREWGGAKVGMIVPAFDEQVMGDASLCGVFPRGLSSKRFLSGVREILAGRSFFPSPEEEEPIFIDRPSMMRRAAQDFGLTAREKEVLSHLVRGASNKDIARALDLQVVTVKLHVRGICRKMKVSNRTQAALTAKENGWG